MKKITALNLLVLLCVLSFNFAVFAQDKTKQIVFIKAGRLIDTRNGAVLQNQGI